MAESVEEPIKYDSLPNFPAEGFPGTDMGATRVPRDSPIRTTPLPPQTWFQRREASLIGSSGVAWKFAVTYFGAVFAVTIKRADGAPSSYAGVLRVAR